MVPHVHAPPLRVNVGPSQPTIGPIIRAYADGVCRVRGHCWPIAVCWNLDLRGSTVPRGLELHAATSLDKFGGKLSGKHLRPYVETNFSERYFLQGSDQISILALFRPEVVEAIERQVPGTEWSMESGGGWLIFYRWQHVVPKHVLMNVIYENAWFANLISNQQLVPLPE